MAVLNDDDDEVYSELPYTKNSHVKDSWHGMLIARKQGGECREIIERFFFNLLTNGFKLWLFFKLLNYTGTLAHAANGSQVANASQI